MAKVRQTVVTGYRVAFGGAWTDIAQGVSERHVLIDSVSNSPGVDHPFLSEHWHYTGAILNGHEGNADWFNCPTGFYGVDLGYNNSAREPDGSLFTELYARTNPANATVQLPVFWIELRDIPDMIFRGGLIAQRLKDRKGFSDLVRKGNTRDLAAANLALQFGWLPFVSDLYKLANFTSAVEKRKKYFDKLKQGKMKCTVGLGSGTKPISGVASIHSDLGIGISSPYVGTAKYEQWGVVKWVADGPAFPRDEPELRRRMLGLTLDQVPINVWNALPWTWLTDYFSNIGNMLKAGNRTVASPLGGCIMTRFVSEVECAPISMPTWNLTSGRLKKWLHSRKVISQVPSTPSFSSMIPSLTGGQLSILGSLAVVKNPRLFQ